MLRVYCTLLMAGEIQERVSELLGSKASLLILF